MSSGTTEAADAGPQAFYFTALARGEFLIQRCVSCKRHVFFPRAMCPHCGSVALDWVKPSGRGKVYSTTVVRKRKSADGADHNVALVDLDEGVRLMSQIVDIPPDAVKIGTRVVASIRQTDGEHKVVFMPASGDDAG